MDLGSIFLILALLVLVGLFVARPLFERSTSAQTGDEQAGGRSQTDAADHDQSALLAERDRVLNALQELDFDNVLGKIPAEDYPQQRAVLLQRGADILRQLDALQAQAGQPAENNIEARIEAAIAARRADLQSASIPAAAGGNGHGRGVSSTIASPDDELEVMLASRRRVRGEKAAGFCPKCGRAVQKSDRFCPKCGAKTA
jgi:hypothetical protein